MNFSSFLLGMVMLGLAIGHAQAGEVHVAVAANFIAAVKELAAKFQASTGNQVIISSGSSGKLYAQIKNGAPYEIMLSADAERPEKLEAEKLAVPGTRFTYALGKLVLWSAQAGYVDPAGRVLATGKFAHLAIANPKTAPYGEAAQQTLEKMRLWDKLQPKLVRGEDIGQTYQFVASGNAELGFVALAQVKAMAGKYPGASYWTVPAADYQPIAQQAVLLEKGRDNPAARAFLAYLRGPAGRRIVEHFGYGVE